MYVKVLENAVVVFGTEVISQAVSMEGNNMARVDVTVFSTSELGDLVLGREQ